MLINLIELDLMSSTVKVIIMLSIYIYNKETLNDIEEHIFH